MYVCLLHLNDLFSEIEPSNEIWIQCAGFLSTYNHSVMDIYWFFVLRHKKNVFVILLPDQDSLAYWFLKLIQGLSLAK